MSLWLFLIGVWLWTVGILTPCVSTIPMTISYFMKHGGKNKPFSGFPLYLSVFIGIVLSVFSQGFANFISMHWLPNMLFAFILSFCYFTAHFVLSLPPPINKSSSNESRADIGTFSYSHFGTCFILCTPPIMVQWLWCCVADLKPIIGMLGFSLHCATFILPLSNLLNKLRKSGGWINTLKVCLAFVELAFALKFTAYLTKSLLLVRP